VYEWRPALEGSLAVTAAVCSDVVEGPLSSCVMRESMPSRLATLTARDDSSNESFCRQYTNKARIK